MRLLNTYGPTEATVVATAADLPPAFAAETWREVPVGRPLAGARAHVLDGGLRPVPVGVLGELFLAGSGVARGYLGLGLQPIKLDDGIGAMVMSVDKSGPATAAGIRQGDVIVGWNNEKLSGVRSLLRTLGPDSVGTVVDVMARRADEPVTFKLTIGERPER